MAYSSESFAPSKVNGLIGTASRSALSASINPALVTADADGKKRIHSLEPVALKNGKLRPLPRTLLNNEIEASTTTSFAVVDASNFVVGEVLYSIAPSVTLQITGVWANGDTATITAGGIPIQATVTSSNINVVASEIAAALNSDKSFSERMLASASPSGSLGMLTIQSKDFKTPYEFLKAVTTVGTGDIDFLSSQTAAPNIAIGTITAIDVSTNTITVSAALSDLAPAAYIGVPDQPAGYVAEEAVLDNVPLDKPLIVSALTDFSARRENLHYVDDDLINSFRLSVI